MIAQGALPTQKGTPMRSCEQGLALRVKTYYAVKRCFITDAMW